MKASRAVIVGVALISCLFVLVVLSFFYSRGSCSEGTFRCGNTSICIPQKSMCNGYDDCPNAEDEEFNTCGDVHGSDLTLKLLRKADDNLTTNYNSCSLANVPRDCLCVNSTYVYCRNMGLTEVPLGISENITRLIVTNNTIKYLDEDVFADYPQLYLIQLGGNQIESLPPKLFRNQKKLVKLLLLNNRLRSLDRNLFLGLQQLNILFLQNNLLTDRDLDAFLHARNLRLLDLSGNRIRLHKNSLPFLPHLVDLMLNDNSIEELQEDTFIQVPNIQSLDLCRNQIRHIHRDTFRHTRNLKDLDLSHNYLSTLPESVFSGLIHLTKLFMGNNPFFRIPSHLFLNLRELSSLDLSEIEITNIDIEMFAMMTNLEFVYLKKFYYCTFVPTVPKCEPKTDGLSTKDNLLGRPVLRITVWIVAFATCIGNMYVFWERLITRDENRVLSWIVRNLAVSDFIMGIYLLFIGSKDVEYRGVYQKVSHEWISSWTCTLVGALAMISSEVSIFILVFMSFERFLLIAIPFGGHRSLTKKTSFLSLAVIWTFGASAAIIPIIQWRNSTRFYGANGMCFPLHLDDPFFAGWQFSAFIFIGINLCCLLIIGVLYTGMFWSIWRTRHATTLNVREFEFAFRFFFIVLTTTACWAPIIVLKFLAFFRTYISEEAYSWVSVFVMPVNSAFNPLLYTLTTPKYREIIKYNISRRIEPLCIVKKNSSGDATYSNSSGNRHTTTFCAAGVSTSSKTNSFDMQTFNTSVDRSSSTGCEDTSGPNSRGNSFEMQDTFESMDIFIHRNVKSHGT
ncbi:UNVERIFIED_CONTAM: hypothetical protein PYX00_003713 [Menopon gallinae]|uniref:G-protein coupled receptors family 1 profile domain-containing protein n=1 Tax=Menopon gallinae TaxID=328185 RepID=A0AAW2I1P4_9NEOP